MRNRKRKSVTAPRLDSLVVPVPHESGGNPVKKKKPFHRFLRWLFPWKGDSVKLILLKSFFLACVVGFCISAYILGNYYWNNLIAENEYSAAQNLIGSSSSSVSSESASSSVNLLPLPAGYQERFNALYQSNQQLRGWVKIEGTNIDYPVAQGSDNDYYLTHTFFKSGSSVGSVFMDDRCKFGSDGMSDNIILYGHNMQTGKMFHDIQNYKNVSYYKQHPVVEFDTVYADADWKIIGMFFTNADFTLPDSFPYHMTFDFMGDDTFYSYINKAMQLSFFTTGVDVRPTDNILMLSTCDNAFENSRLVLVARKVRDGESSSVNTDAAVQNQSQYLPQNYIGKFGGTYRAYDENYAFYSAQ